VVVGLGPAGPELLTAGARDALDRFESARWVRTTRHPCAEAFTWSGSFDSIYDAATSVDDVYPAIVDALVEAAEERDVVLYAVPGSPRVAERSVELLLADGRVAVEVLPALSFLDLAWVRLGVDPLRDGVRVIEGHDFAVHAAGERGPLLVSHCHSREVLSEVKLAFGDSVPPTVTVIQRLGLPDERIFDVAGDDLDRSFDPDHLTSLYIAVLATPVASELVAFAEVVRRLRAECPWDREQTHESLTRHLLEETYEVLEAIEGLPDSYPHLEEELGDLLFQVFFHSVIAAEQGEFTLADVARGIHDKLVRRHPHVFAGLDVDSADQVVRNWEEIKKAEKGRASVMEGIPGNLPALLYAYKVLGKAASSGYDGTLPSPSSFGVGGELLDVVRRARAAGDDPEAALRAAVASYRDAFIAWESSRDGV
jgi:tetrapyrrole methylase family protein / MazG family protein